MPEDRCLICGKRYPAGLHILGCLICFPCERRLMRLAAPPEKRRRLCRLYAPAALRGGGQV